MAFCWRMRSDPRPEVLSIFVEKISTVGSTKYNASLMPFTGALTVSKDMGMKARIRA